MIDKGNYYQWYLQGYFESDTRASKVDKVCLTLTTRGNTKIAIGEGGNELMNLRIRKLTPKECFRLMGVKDSDYINCAKNQSEASLYHLAGDSIVVNVLMAIFSQML